MMIAKLHLTLQELKVAALLYVQSRYAQCFEREWSCKDTHCQCDFVLWLISIQCSVESSLLVLWLAARTSRSWLSWSTSSPISFKKSVSMISLIASYFKENRRLLMWHVWQEHISVESSLIKVITHIYTFFYIQLQCTTSILWVVANLPHTPGVLSIGQRFHACSISNISSVSVCSWFFIDAFYKHANILHLILQ